MKTTTDEDSPGVSGESFHIRLDKDWFVNNNILQETQEVIVVSEPKAIWWQRILNKITFNIYKPTNFSYRVKLKE